MTTDDILEKVHVCVLVLHARLHGAGLTGLREDDRHGESVPELQTFSAGTLGKFFFFFFEATVVFFMKHLRYVSALSLSCQPVLMINVKLSDRIPVPTSLRGDER